MADSIWQSTLAELRDQLAGRDPVPAGVSLAAVSASLGLGLLVKVLEITRNRKDFAGDPRKTETLAAAARTASERLASLADEDVAAYAEYMARREPSSLRKAIETPLAAARAAAESLKLCEEASRLAPRSLAPDLGTVALLLAASVRGMLLSVDSNAGRLSDLEFQNQVKAEVAELTELAKIHQRW